MASFTGGPERGSSFKVPDHVDLPSTLLRTMRHGGHTRRYHYELLTLRVICHTHPPGACDAHGRVTQTYQLVREEIRHDH